MGGGIKMIPSAKAGNLLLKQQSHEDYESVVAIPEFRHALGRIE
jgi:hypothetical protein